MHDYAFYYRENRKQMLLLLAPSPSIHVYKPQSLKLLDATSPIKTKPHRGHPWLVALAFPPLHRHSCSTSPPYRHPRLLHRRQQRQRLFSSPPPSTWLLKVGQAFVLSCLINLPIYPRAEEEMTLCRGEDCSCQDRGAFPGGGAAATASTGSRGDAQGWAIGAGQPLRLLHHDEPAQCTLPTPSSFNLAHS